MKRVSNAQIRFAWGLIIIIKSWGLSLTRQLLFPLGVTKVNIIYRSISLVHGSWMHTRRPAGQITCPLQLLEVIHRWLHFSTGKQTHRDHEVESINRDNRSQANHRDIRCTGHVYWSSIERIYNTFKSNTRKWYIIEQTIYFLTSNHAPRRPKLYCHSRAVTHCATPATSAHSVDASRY